MMCAPDKLDELCRMQGELNDNIFRKKDIRDNEGRVLTMARLREVVAAGPLGPNTEVNRWLRNYLDALDDESRELREELLWKWWSKDHLDLQNIRIEIIDQLHFWLSLALTAGLDAGKIFEIYAQKNAVNFQRQETGYSRASKTEDDNQGIKT